MPKCTDCRASDALTTWQERVAQFFGFHIFPTTFKDERSTSYTRGFEEGYAMGRKHENELRQKDALLKYYTEKKLWVGVKSTEKKKNEA